MSSILTNNSAMIALQTMKGVNKQLAETQSQISTGKSVATSKDNAAVWAISKTMESDVKGFKGISDSLSLGSSTVSVARQASEKVTELLTEIKGKTVAAQEQNVDRVKIQTDIKALRDQIATVVNSAQFNGLNMIKGSEDVNVLSSLDRSSNGDVKASQITVARADLSTATGTFGAGTALNANATVSNTGAGALDSTGNTAVVTMATGANYSTGTATFTVAGTQFSFAAGELGGAGDNQDVAAANLSAKINALGIAGVTASATGAAVTLTSARAFEGVNVQVNAVGGAAATSSITAVNGAGPSGTNTATNSTVAERALNVTFSNAAAVQDGDSYRVSFAGEQFDYVAGRGQNFEDVTRGLKAAIDGRGMTGITTSVSKDNTGNWQIKIDNSTATARTLSSVGNAGGVASGGLFGLDGIDVTTTAGAKSALENIETMINKSIDASAAFGSAEKRIDIQKDFVGVLSDALKSGIGSMVDADMEAVSARLQALQVQQQLGTQALTIANQQPQNILALFR
jgi:flagellin